MSSSTSPGRDDARDPARPRQEDLGSLLALAARGDAEAFMRFYDRTSTTAYRAARAICADQTCAERMTCALYLRAWTKAAEHARSSLSPTGWLLAGIAEPGVGLGGCDADPAEAWARGA